MTSVASSKSGVPVRLTDERWAHVTEEHAELAGLRLDVLTTVAEPERILAGRAGAQVAIRQVAEGKWLAVVYRESGDDGFVITAFLTRRVDSLKTRRQLWP